MFLISNKCDLDSWLELFTNINLNCSTLNVPIYFRESHRNIALCTYKYYYYLKEEMLVGDTGSTIFYFIRLEADLRLVRRN